MPNWFICDVGDMLQFQTASLPMRCEGGRISTTEHCCVLKILCVRRIQEEHKKCKGPWANSHAVYYHYFFMRKYCCRINKLGSQCWTAQPSITHRSFNRSHPMDMGSLGAQCRCDLCLCSPSYHRAAVITQTNNCTPYASAYATYNS